MRHYATTDQPKSWGDGRVVKAAGAGWRWEPLATDLHSGGQGVSVAVPSTGAKVELGCNLGVGAALSRDSTAPPSSPHHHMGTGLENVAQTKLASSNSVSIPQLAGHPVTRSRTSQESTKTCHCILQWSMEREDTHGHHIQQQAGANDSPRRPRTVEIEH